MELSKVIGITAIVLGIIGMIALIVIAVLGGSTQCPEGHHAVDITYYNVALKLPATMTVCR